MRYGLWIKGAVAVALIAAFIHWMATPVAIYPQGRFWGKPDINRLTRTDRIGRKDSFRT